jgi:hypothetical protein
LVRISENTGGTFLQKNVGLWAAAERCSLAWADFDKDGFLDLAMAGTGSVGGRSGLYHNSGTKTFTQVGNLPSVFSCSVAWGDYDNDGDPDLALAGQEHDTSTLVTKILRNDDGTFVEVASLTGIALCSLAWGDYNNDGHLELLMAGATNTTTYDPICRIVSYDGTSVFTEKDVGLAGVCYCHVSWGDYNSDGKLDIAITGLDQNGDGVCSARSLPVAMGAPSRGLTLTMMVTSTSSLRRLFTSIMESETSPTAKCLCMVTRFLAVTTMMMVTSTSHSTTRTCHNSGATIVVMRTLCPMLPAI